MPIGTIVSGVIAALAMKGAEKITEKSAEKAFENRSVNSLTRALMPSRPVAPPFLSIETTTPTSPVPFLSNLGHACTGLV